MKKLLLLLLLPLLSYGQTQIGDDIDGEAFNDGFGASVSLSEDGTIVAIGAHQGSVSYVKIYKNVDNTWQQIGQNIESDQTSDFFGWSVSLSSNGNFIAVGARFNDGNDVDDSFRGQVRVFENQNDSWVQIGDDIDGDFQGDQSGWSVSLSSNANIIAIGSPKNFGNGSSSGTTRVYELINDTWEQVGEDIDGEAPVGSSGESISISNDGSILAIGAPNNVGNGNNSGHTRIFKNQNGSWVQIGQDIDGEGFGNFSGESVSITGDGNRVVIGAGGFDNGGQEAFGKVRIFENNNDQWTQLGGDIIGEFVGDRLGREIQISSNGNFVVIGAPKNMENGVDSGYAIVYGIIDNEWIQIGEIIYGDNSEYFFGSSVSISSDGNTIAIGAPCFNNFNRNGFVQIYDLSSVLSTKEPIHTSFTIYPNPASTSIQIDIKENNLLQKTTIYNSLGQEVLQSTQTNIDVSSLSKGVYVVEVQSTTGKGSEKLIIN